MQLLVQYAPDWALPYVYQVDDAEWMLAIDVASVLIVVVGLALFSYCLLQSLGWQRYRGRWYSPDQSHALARELRAAARSGKTLDVAARRILKRCGETSSGLRSSSVQAKADHF